MTAGPEGLAVARPVVSERPLLISLDTQMPAALHPGRGTALFVSGWCVSPRAPIRALSLLVDGDAQGLMAERMPRLDVFRALHPEVDPFGPAAGSPDAGSPDDPLGQGYRSGFWGLARVAPRDGDAPCALVLRAELEDGQVVSEEIAVLPVAPLPGPLALLAPAPTAGPLVAICMATYEPPRDLFRRQVESIRAQTHGNWVCVISDDCSGAEGLAAIHETVAGDPRFVVSRSAGRLGFYRNFERALALAPAAAELVAMADQDDAWRPEKLETLIAQLGAAQLVYSDARVVDRRGALISETYWARRDNNHSDLLSLLVANAVTGAASLMRRELLDDALPFPPDQFAHFHDHWIALAALARGEIAFVDQPLYDYVQHGDATLGHAAANRLTGLSQRVRALGRDPHERVRDWRQTYFVDACRLMQFTTILLMRCGEGMAPAKRRVLERFLLADRSPRPLVELGLRGARELVGRPQTLGAEWLLLHAFAWRRLLGATVRDRPQRGWRLDAGPPQTFDPRPGGPATPDDPGARSVAAKIAPLRLAVSETAPTRVNVLIPTIDLDHFFGGYIGKFNLARRLADHGLRVRIVTVDPVPTLPPSWRRTIESFGGLDGLMGRVEVAFGRESPGLEVSRGDRFVATTWWTAHIACQAVEQLDPKRFLYLIQEYEPFTFPMGTLAALASESYRFDHHALFSTELLRDYFRRHAIGVYAHGASAGDAASVAFENAITAVTPPSAQELAARRSRSLLFYARPEPHAARNMFELGLLALGRALAAGAFADGWELHGIGNVDGRRRLELGDGVALDLLPRSGQSDYAALLRRHDVGLSLMYTPHPSLVPIEMASAGMVTVTNSFENKTPAAMAAISGNFITAAPSVHDLAGALVRAAAQAEDFERRARGSEVHWSRDWDDSFDDAVMARIVSFLDA